MDGLFHGKPLLKMDDLGGFPIIFGLTPNTPPKINGWNLEMVVSNRNLLFQGAPIFRFHVCFGGCHPKCCFAEIGHQFHTSTIESIAQMLEKCFFKMSPKY